MGFADQVQLLRSTGRSRFGLGNPTCSSCSVVYSLLSLSHSLAACSPPPTASSSSSPGSLACGTPGGSRAMPSWGKPEFRSEAPQISLRKCVDRAPKFRASFAQISWETQAINCVNIQCLHTPLPIILLILSYSTLCAPAQPTKPPCACYSAAPARSAGNLRASAQLDEPRGRFRREQRRCRETKRSSLPRPRRRNAPRLPFWTTFA